MQYVIWKLPRDINERFYLTGSGIWSHRECDAKHYTLHGARSLIGRMERKWGVDLKQPKEWGFYALEVMK